MRANYIAAAGHRMASAVPLMAFGALKVRISAIRLDLIPFVIIVGAQDFTRLFTTNARLGQSHG